MEQKEIKKLVADLLNTTHGKESGDATLFLSDLMWNKLAMELKELKTPTKVFNFVQEYFSNIKETEQVENNNFNSNPKNLIGVFNSGFYANFEKERKNMYMHTIKFEQIFKFVKDFLDMLSNDGINSILGRPYIYEGADKGFFAMGLLCTIKNVEDIFPKEVLAHFTIVCNNKDYFISMVNALTDDSRFSVFGNADLG